MTTSKRNSTFKTIIWLGLVTGTLDAVAAMIWNYKITAGTLFRYIASGVFGKAAFKGHMDMALWGVFFHYVIAYAFTAVLYITYPSFISALKNKYVTAVVFAAITWLITNLVIVPLSRIGWHTMHLHGILIGFGILILTIGLPIVLVADRKRK